MLAYILTGLFAVVFELVYFRLAERCNIVCEPTPRGSHAVSTIRGGGIVFPVAVWLWAALSGFVYPWFLAGLTLAAAISFADDLSPLPDTVRLAVHFAAVILMVVQVHLWLLMPWWGVLLVVLFCVGLVNACNFMDGINGMTAAYSLSVLAPLIYLDVVGEEYVSLSYLIVVAIVVLVFGFFNFRRAARCFAGDAGSISMAFMLVFPSMMLCLSSRSAVYVGFFLVYGVDAVMTMLHRAFLGENLRQAHRRHLYQLLANERRMPQLLVSALYAAIQAAISFGLIFLPVDPWLYLFVVTSMLVVTYLWVVRNCSFNRGA